MDEFDAEKALPEIKRGTAISNPVEKKTVGLSFKM
jgi:hypothetical protein